METADNKPESGNSSKNMESSTGKEPETSSLKPNANLKTSLFIFYGVIASAFWLTLFVTGLFVDSSYYRVALNYNFAGLSDWLWVILSFTLTNVSLLAFFAGLLGGICSKVLTSEGFTLSPTELKNKKVSYILYENPFISAFRGLFVFVAILSIQYLSSFSDLGSISNKEEQVQAEIKVDFDNSLVRLAESTTDSATLQEIKKIKNEKLLISPQNETDSLLFSIFQLKDSIELLNTIYTDGEKITNDSLKHEKQKLNLRIRSLRRSLKAPATADFSNIGFSSFSYFKFAVIVSLLAFIFGYEPRKFANFLSKIKILSPDDKNPNKDGSEKNN
jgi:hypothetical protein